MTATRSGDWEGDADRKARRRRKGKTTIRPNGRGRRLLGSWGDRKRAFERDEVLRDRAVVEAPLSQFSHRQWQRFADVQARQSRS